MLEILITLLLWTDSTFSLFPTKGVENQTQKGPLCPFFFITVVGPRCTHDLIQVKGFPWDFSVEKTLSSLSGGELYDWVPHLQVAWPPSCGELWKEKEQRRTLVTSSPWPLTLKSSGLPGSCSSVSNPNIFSLNFPFPYASWSWLPVTCNCKGFN